MSRYLVIFAILNFAIGLAFNAYLPLYVDEAYYFLWSKFLDFGYLDHPPLIALVIFVSSIFGQDAFFVRLGVWACYAISAYTVYLLGTKAYSKQIGIYAGAIVAVSPAVTMGMSLATPDAPLVLFWALCLYFGYLAIFEENSKTINYILAGICLGLAMDSKYSAVLLAFSLLAFVLFYKPKTFLNPKIYLVPLFALLFFAPVLWWNYTNDFASFKFQINREILKANGLDEFLQFFGGQFALFSPIFALILFYDIYKFKSWELKDKFFAFCAYGVLIFFFYKSFYGHTELNWGAPAYLAASIIAARRLVDMPRLMIAGVAICLIATFVIRFPLLFGLDGARNPHQRIFGYKEAAQRVADLKTPNDAVMSDHLTNASILWFYLDMPITIPTDTRVSMFDYWGLGKNAPTKSGIYISRDEKSAELGKKYKNVILLEKFNASKAGFKSREFWIYRVSVD